MIMTHHDAFYLRLFEKKHTFLRGIFFIFFVRDKSLRLEDLLRIGRLFSLSLFCNYFVLFQFQKSL